MSLASVVACALRERKKERPSGKTLKLRESILLAKISNHSSLLISPDQIATKNFCLKRLLSQTQAHRRRRHLLS